MEPKSIVKTIAIIILVLSILGMLGNIFYIVIYLTLGSNAILAEAISQTGYALGEIAVSASISFIVSIFLVIGSIGLLTHKRWARNFTVTTIIISLAVGLIKIIYVAVTGKPLAGAIISYIFSLVIWGFFIYLLSKQKVKKFLYSKK